MHSETPKVSHILGETVDLLWRIVNQDGGDDRHCYNTTQYHTLSHFSTQFGTQFYTIPSHTCVCAPYSGAYPTQRYTVRSVDI